MDLTWHSHPVDQIPKIPTAVSKNQKEQEVNIASPEVGLSLISCYMPSESQAHHPIQNCIHNKEELCFFKVEVASTVQDEDYVAK